MSQGMYPLNVSRDNQVGCQFGKLGLDSLNIPKSFQHTPKGLGNLWQLPLAFNIWLPWASPGAPPLVLSFNLYSQGELSWISMLVVAAMYEP